MINTDLLMTSSKQQWVWSGEMHGFLSHKPEMTVTEGSIMALPVWLTGETGEHRGRAVKSRGPLTEWYPSWPRYRGRSPSPGGSGCGAPNVSKATSVNSGSACGEQVHAALVGDVLCLCCPAAFFC